jgi:hypothetical protein
MILYNVAQARSYTLVHNKKLHDVLDSVIGAVTKAVEEGKFRTGNLRFSPEELKDNENFIPEELNDNEAFIRGYFESLGYKCSISESRGAIFINVSWY